MSSDGGTRLILGTAGHIDHGKTALVRALSGVDCDRLPEEKARGITIELGFAPLDLPSGQRVGVVDVPGHERLVRTMVAGATGIDLVLFVVAADEGMMPQSREHLAICDLLGITRGVVALTKTDAVDEDLAELARLDVEDELAGTGLAGAKIVPVSAHAGTGLEELLAELDRLVAESPERAAASGPAWLPVDRVFTMRGFGTVVTGTLRGSELGEGEPVDVFPEGTRDVLEARVRGIQVHGESVERAAPGARCAINLGGVEVAAVPRGSVVAAPGRLDYRPRLGVELALLPGAKPLASNSRWTLHVGTAERGVRVLLLESDTLAPGARGFAELSLDAPVPAFEGDRFILRGFRRLQGAGWTIGGGRVLDASPLRGRRPRQERTADLEIFAGDDRPAALATRLRRLGFRGGSEAELRREVLSVDGLDGVALGGGRWIDPDAFAQLVDRCVSAVERHHVDAPQDPWVGLAAVVSRIEERVAEDAVRAALDAGVRDGRLVAGGSGVRTKGHTAHVRDAELLERARARLHGAGLAPPTQAALAEELGCATRDLRSVLDHLVRGGDVVRVAQGLFFDAPSVDRLREAVVAFLKTHGEIDPAAYKTLTGQSRKHTVPLMEYFDATRVTVRRENVRVLRG